MELIGSGEKRRLKVGNQAQQLPVRVILPLLSLAPAVSQHWDCARDVVFISFWGIINHDGVLGSVRGRIASVHKGQRLPDKGAGMEVDILSNTFLASPYKMKSFSVWYRWVQYFLSHLFHPHLSGIGPDADCVEVAEHKTKEIFQERSFHWLAIISINQSTVNIQHDIHAKSCARFFFLFHHPVVTSSVKNRNMDEDGFEAHYDVILSGTGLVQSILSAALSKSGKKVLHLDKNDFYGGDHNSTHTLEQFLALCAKRKENRGCSEATFLENETGESVKPESENIEKLCADFLERGQSV